MHESAKTRISTLLGSRLSESAERIEAKSIYFVRTFAPKTPVQMFAYLISEVLCNIYQACMTTLRKGASPDLTATFGSREVSLESISEAPGRKIIFYVFNLSSLRKS